MEDKTLSFDCSTTDSFHKSLCSYLAESGTSMGTNEEIGLVYDGSEEITIRKIEYFNPNYVFLHGVDGQSRTYSVFAHVRTVHLKIRKITLTDEKERKPIIFLNEP